MELSPGVRAQDEGVRSPPLLRADHLCIFHFLEIRHSFTTLPYINKAFGGASDLLCD